MPTLARKAVKTAVLPAGMMSRRHPGDIVILIYHRVGDGPGEIELPAAAFERHLITLAHDRVVTLDDAVAPGSDGGVVVTFDDGYRDFYDVVLPLLVRHGTPALLYLATGFVEGESLAADPSVALTWGQLEEAVSTGLVTVGAHTHSHINLSKAPGEVAVNEMQRSKGIIEDRLGVECKHFAYPWAVASPSADAAARAIFATAALDAWRTNRAGAIDPHRLGRTPVLRSDGQFFFRRKRHGHLDTEAVVYRAIGRGPWGQA